MKQLLIIRFPKDLSPVTVKEIGLSIKDGASDIFHCVFVPDAVDRWEFEIIYNPHFKYAAESIGPAEPFKVEL